MIVSVNVACVFAMYCLALAEAEGSLSEKAAAAVLFTYNIVLILIGAQNV